MTVQTSELNTQAVLAMKGAGYYSARTAGAKHAIDKVRPMLEDALQSLPQQAVLRLADFGAADGGTSQEMWAGLIEALRASGDSRPIEMLYTDLASNDFSTLFRTRKCVCAWLRYRVSPTAYGRCQLVSRFLSNSYALCIRKTVRD